MVKIVKKATFYRYAINEERQVIAVKTQGYSEGDLGAYKEGKYWVVIYIPTGIRLSADLATTRVEALAEVKQWIATRFDLADKIQKYMASDNHAKFMQSKYDQTVTEVF